MGKSSSDLNAHKLKFAAIYNSLQKMKDKHQKPSLPTTVYQACRTHDETAELSFKLTKAL